MRWLTILLAVLLLVLQYRFWIGQGSYANVTALQRQIKEQQALNLSLEQQNIKLQHEVDALKNSLDAVEERARQHLGMIKKGEKLYILGEESKRDR
jgi:cell division protein FtsB